MDFTEKQIIPSTVPRLAQLTVDGKVEVTLSTPPAADDEGGAGSAAIRSAALRAVKAHACGFADPVQFIRAFRRVYGMTPLEYRASMLDAAMRAQRDTI